MIEIFLVKISGSSEVDAAFSTEQAMLDYLAQRCGEPLTEEAVDALFETGHLQCIELN